jgi:hypothetical protein
VERVIIEGGGPSACARQGRRAAPSLVISNADAKRTLLELAGKTTLAGDSPALREYRMALPLFIIYMAMQVPPDELGLPNSNIYLMPGYTLRKTTRPVTARAGAALHPHSIASLKDPQCQGIAPPGYQPADDDRAGSYLVGRALAGEAALPPHR